MSKKRTELYSKDELNQIIGHGNFEEMIGVLYACKKRANLCKDLKFEIGKYVIPKYFVREATELIMDKRKYYKKKVKINEKKAISLNSPYINSKYDEEKLHDILIEYPNVTSSIKKKMLYTYNNLQLELKNQLTVDAFKKDLHDITTYVYCEDKTRDIRITRPEEFTGEHENMYSIFLKNPGNNINEDFYTHGMIIDNVDCLGDYLADKDRDECIDLRYKINDDFISTNRIKDQIYKALIQRHYENECKFIDKNPGEYINKDYINPRTNKATIETSLTSKADRQRTYEDMVNLKKKYQLSDNVMKTKLIVDKPSESTEALKGAMRRFDEIEGSDEEILNHKISQMTLTTEKTSNRKRRKSKK